MTGDEARAAEQDWPDDVMPPSLPWVAYPEPDDWGVAEGISPLWLIEDADGRVVTGGLTPDEAAIIRVAVGERAALRAALTQAEAALLQANECGHLRGGGLCRVCRLGNSVTLAAIRAVLREA